MDYWAAAPMEREQAVLFAPTLDEMIAEDHPVRLVDEILGSCDWSEWESEYHGRVGQPPIHPRILAAALLYGMSRSIRSSRVLEYVVQHNIDFLWLVKGHHLDHSTICDFRKRFGKKLRDVFRQITRIAMEMGYIVLSEIALDGTRVRANNARYRTLTAADVEKLLTDIDAQIEEAFQQFETADARDQKLFETEAQKLPSDLRQLKRRQEHLAAVLKKLQDADQARRRDGIDVAKNPAQVPITDPDSKVLPNKEGGYAPNYTPMAATDAHRGFIVDVDVIEDTSEHLVTVPCVDRIEESFGSCPQNFLADPAHATGPNMEDLENRGVNFFTPVVSNAPQPGNPALREDPTQPVAEVDWDKLPINPQTKKFDKSAFVYDEEQDKYYCPTGRPLDREELKPKKTAAGKRINVIVYRSANCTHCPLSHLCRLEKSKKGRSISRDQYEKRRQKMATKMSQDAGKAIYRKRLHTAETPFAIIKSVMNFRRFLLRGMENVKTEWLWVCTAFNLTKLARAMAKLRAGCESTGIAME